MPISDDTIREVAHVRRADALVNDKRLERAVRLIQEWLDAQTEAVNVELIVDEIAHIILTYSDGDTHRI